MIMCIDNQSNKKINKSMLFSQPSDGLKSKEKQDEEERKKIEELERQREERMVPEDIVTARNAKPTPKHRYEKCFFSFTLYPAHSRVGRGNWC